MVDSTLATLYENGNNIGYSEGFNACKEDLMDIIRTLAFQVAQYQNPKAYDYSDEILNNIMIDAGLDKSYLE